MLQYIDAGLESFWMEHAAVDIDYNRPQQARPGFWISR